ncbi:MAG: pilus assembly protein [Novosphingobium sp. 35-62-5]|nr:MAG: pilus assembly protein [Novosphingobium sp. 35-62-5]
MKVLLTRFVREEHGSTALEYGLIAALVAVAAMTAMGSLGNSLSTTFGLVSSNMVKAQDGKL